MKRKIQDNKINSNKKSERDKIRVFVPIVCRPRPPCCSSDAESEPETTSGGKIATLLLVYNFLFLNVYNSNRATSKH
jgi:hypothetical protein